MNKPVSPSRAITFSSGIARIRGLKSALAIDEVQRWMPWHRASALTRDDTVVLGWGAKRNTRRARQFAARQGLPYVTLEDGFLRSVGLGADAAPPYGIVADDIGVYYDARRPSRLEQLLNGLPVAPLFAADINAAVNDPLQDVDLIKRARRCIDDIVKNKLSKYNVSPELVLPRTAQKRVLVVDQTAGDLSISCGLANTNSFRTMLRVAREENPLAEILIKTHPDVVSGHKRGHFNHGDTDERTRLITTDINPIHLLEQVDKVYVVTSQLGFEALMVGLPVICFGAPFYSGWGLTDDRCPIPRRRATRSLEEVFSAAYLLYSHYIDPDTGQRCEIERVIAHLALQRQWFHRNQGTWLGYGISWWKRWWVRRYLRSPWNSVRFYQRARAIPPGLDPSNTRILVWGLRDTASLRRHAAACGYPIWRMEDGFLRSVGLGTDLTTPVSQTIDSQGIYFDPAHPSDLETLLANTQFTADELERARTFRERLLKARISKYNVGNNAAPLRVRSRPGQPVILVPGQVEHDASVQMGCTNIRTNADLLAAVRACRPDAHILYKPHPDVVSGNRRGDTRVPDPAHFDDEIRDASIAACLDVADEVHTLTSLVGFEALLRAKPVVTYGLPFYAGWGLTMDRESLSRRARRLSLDELTAGVLIRYPRYVSDISGEFTSPEGALNRLCLTLDRQPANNARHGLGHRAARNLLGFAMGVGRELIVNRR